MKNIKIIMMALFLMLSVIGMNQSVKAVTTVYGHIYQGNWEETGYPEYSQLRRCNMALYNIDLGQYVGVGVINNFGNYSISFSNGGAFDYYQFNPECPVGTGMFMAGGYANIVRDTAFQWNGVGQYTTHQ